MPSHKFVIKNHWDAKALGPEQYICLELNVTEEILEFKVHAPFHNDEAPKAAPGRLWELWTYEVVELFIAGPEQHYIEIELGPHGHYLALTLSGERNIIKDDLKIQYTSAIDGNTWRGEAKIAIGDLPVGPHKLNAYAINGHGHSRRYLALFPTPGNKPDFHQLISMKPVDLT